MKKLLLILVLSFLIFLLFLPNLLIKEFQNNALQNTLINKTYTVENVTHTLPISENNETLIKNTDFESYETFDLNKISISIKKETVTPEGVTIVIKDLNRKKPTTGLDYYIQRKNNNSWENYPFLSDTITWNLLALVGENYTLEQKLNFKTHYGELPSGIYRIKKILSIDNINYDIYSNEFEIK